MDGEGMGFLRVWCGVVWYGMGRGDGMGLLLGIYCFVIRECACVCAYVCVRGVFFWEGRGARRRMGDGV